jgi:class 3 adenylate cyclase
MQRDAALCVKMMGIHNTVLRRTVTTHAGHVIEQEGDSWSIAFHRPVDAVAFCLQVGSACDLLECTTCAASRAAFSWHMAVGKAVVLWPGTISS